MRKLLQTVVTGAQGTGTAGKVPGFTTFAKTGTTDNNENSWYVGGTPYAAAGIWTGYETPTEMSNAESAYAAKIWRAIMKKYLEDKSPLEFEDDSNVIVRSYCAQTGCLASSSCSQLLTGYYTSDNLPPVCRTGHSSSYKTYNDNNNTTTNKYTSSESTSSSNNYTETTNDETINEETTTKNITTTEDDDNDTTAKTTKPTTISE